MLVGMNEHAGPSAVEIVPTTLDVYRFYSAVETAERFDATVEALDEVKTVRRRQAGGYPMRP